MPRKIRPIRVEGQLAYVPLSQGLEAVIDAADVHLVDGRNWCALKGRHTFYAVTTLHLGNRTKQTLRMHRLLTKYPGGKEVDHIDGDGLNNRRANLREATASQNASNRRRSSTNKSGFKGVFWSKELQKWHARIKLHGRQIHLGFYQSRESAHKAYCDASAKYHGEFGRTA